MLGMQGTQHSETRPKLGDTDHRNTQKHTWPISLEKANVEAVTSMVEKAKILAIGTPTACTDTSEATCPWAGFTTVNENECCVFAGSVRLTKRRRVRGESLGARLETAFVQVPDDATLSFPP